jgi:hypothetical protein
MGTLYAGERIFYTEDERYYDSSAKRIEYNPVTLEPINSVQVVSETATTGPELETVAKIEKETVTPLKCKQCEFVAKSNAGLAVHKKKHER